MQRAQWTIFFLLPGVLGTLFVSGVFLKNRNQDLRGEVAGAAVARAAPKTQSLLPPERLYAPFGDRSLQDVFQKSGITVYPEDRVTVIPPLEYGVGGEVIIERATPVVVRDATLETLYRTWQKNVQGLLQEQRIALGLLDAIDPSLETALTPNMQVAITRVEETELSITEKIPFKTVEKEDPALDRGKTRIEKEGVTGEKTLTYKLRRENGVEVSRTLLKTEVNKEAQDKVVIKGTKTVVLGEGIATWYSTAGLVAAHNTLPRGKMVLVRNLSNNKTVVVQIVGGGIQGRAIIDLSPEAFKAISTAGLGAGVLNVRIEEQ